MKIYLATDHAGLELKEAIKSFLQEKGYEIVDCGAYSFDKNDDYPDFISKAADNVAKDLSAKGIIFGGSGQGEAIVANKFPGIRCGVFYGPRLPLGDADATGRSNDDPYELLRLNREHNDANMLSLAARFLSVEEAKKAVDVWLHTPFSNDERHVRRIEKIAKIEQTNASK